MPQAEGIGEGLVRVDRVSAQGGGWGPSLRFQGCLEGLARLAKELKLFLKKAGNQARLGCPDPTAASLKPQASLR